MTESTAVPPLSPTDTTVSGRSSGRRVLIAVVAVVAVLAAGVTALRLTETWPFDDDTGVMDALRYLPADATLVQVRNQEAAEQRLQNPDAQFGVLGGYPTQTPVVFVVPDESLIIFGESDRVMDVVNGESDALADEDDVSRLLDGVADLEYLAVNRRATTCADPGSLLGSRLTPERLEAVLEQIEDSGLGQPDATASMIVGDGEDILTRSRLLFDDEDEATQDSEARADYLAKGTNAQTDEPMGDILDVGDISVDGSVETVEYTYAGGGVRLFQGVQMRDVPATFCLAS